MPNERFPIGLVTIYFKCVKVTRPGDTSPIIKRGSSRQFYARAPTYIGSKRCSHHLFVFAVHNLFTFTLSLPHAYMGRGLV